MTPEVLQKLIASGQAQFGTWTSGAGLMLFDVPTGKGITITDIRINAFADLPAGQTFVNLNTVGLYTWHQLRVIGKMGINTFQARHQLQLIATDAAPAIIPVGYTDFEVFINQVDNILFELTHFTNGQLTVTPGLLPAATKFPVAPVPPDGYGKQGIAGSINTVALIRQGANFELKMFGEKQTSVLSRNVSNQMSWPVISSTALNDPQFTIPFGYLTCPIIQIKYVLYNKTPDNTFSKPV